jgi:LuxR family maltose regulon positive regulatory protein
VFQAVAFAKQNRTREGLHALQEALTLAEPEGYVRIFLDEGEPVRGLLHRIRSDNPDALLRKYSERLLIAFGEIVSNASPSPTSKSLPEPLSAREVEVLRLVGQGLSNREIADRLVISLPTVKKHVENIHGKLGVKNRSQAILRAQELKLL